MGFWKNEKSPKIWKRRIEIHIFGKKKLCQSFFILRKLFTLNETSTYELFWPQNFIWWSSDPSALSYPILMYVRKTYLYTCLYIALSLSDSSSFGVSSSRKSSSFINWNEKKYYYVDISFFTNNKFLREKNKNKKTWD
jgi:hypothetical protein